MRFALLEDQHPPSWMRLMVQAALIAPITTVLLWVFFGGMLDLSCANRIFPVRFYLQDLADDFSYAIAMFVAGCAAGIAMAHFVPSFRSTGRWLWLAGVLLLARSASSFSEYAQYSYRETPLLTFWGWVVDLEQWPAYLYLGYSVGMTLWTRRAARKLQQTTDRSAVRRVLGLKLAKFAVGAAGLLAALPIVSLLAVHRSR